MTERAKLEKHFNLKKVFYLNSTLKKTQIAIIGQGYVGLPLTVEFGKSYPTVGFDINATRIEQLKKGIDSTRELMSE